MLQQLAVLKMKDARSSRQTFRSDEESLRQTKNLERDLKDLVAVITQNPCLINGGNLFYFTRSLLVTVSHSSHSRTASTPVLEWTPLFLLLLWFSRRLFPPCRLSYWSRSSSTRIPLHKTGTPSLMTTVCVERIPPASTPRPRSQRNLRKVFHTSERKKSLPSAEV